MELRTPYQTSPSETSNEACLAFDSSVFVSIGSSNQQAWRNERSVQIT